MRALTINEVRIGGSVAGAIRVGMYTNRALVEFIRRLEVDPADMRMLKDAVGVPDVIADVSGMGMDPGGMLSYVVDNVFPTDGRNEDGLKGYESWLRMTYGKPERSAYVDWFPDGRAGYGGDDGPLGTVNMCYVWEVMA